MPLRFVLRPNEKVIINGAVISLGDRPGTLFIYNKVNFLRGREVLKEEEADTLIRKLYFVIQMIYLFPEENDLNLERFRVFSQAVREEFPAKGPILDEIAELVYAGNLYRALKICGKHFGIKDARPEGPAAELER